MANEPMHIYPDPDGTANSTAYVPSNTTLSGAAIVSGGVAVGTAATGLGPALITHALAFVQAVPGGAAGPVRFLGIHGLGPKQVAVILIFGSLSVLLQVINLAMGLRMKERLRGLSRKVCDLCEKAGLLKAA